MVLYLAEHRQNVGITHTVSVSHVVELVRTMHHGGLVIGCNALGSALRA